MRFPGDSFNLWNVACFDPLSTALSVGGSLVSGLIGSNAASNAASTQANAANTAAANTLAQFNKTQANLAPYMGYGTTAGNSLIGQLPQLSSQFNPTQANLEATPGYQFTLDQGLKGVQNAASAKGLGVSGAAMKGAADYATGLANNTYQTQFNIDQANKNNAFNKLLAVTGVGQNAAAGVGNLGQTATQNANNFATTGAAATAAGDIGGANAFNSGVTNAINNYNQYGLINRLLPNGQNGGGASAP